MRNFTGKIYRENTASQFIFDNHFQKVVPFLKLCEKIL